MLIIGLSLFPMSQLPVFSQVKICAVGSLEIEKELLLTLIFRVFFTTTRLV